MLKAAANHLFYLLLTLIVIWRSPLNCIQSKGIWKDHAKYFFVTFPQSHYSAAQCNSFSLGLTDKSARSSLSSKTTFWWRVFFKEEGEKRGNFSVTSDETLPSQANPVERQREFFLHSYDFLIFVLGSYKVEFISLSCSIWGVPFSHGKMSIQTRKCH